MVNILAPSLRGGGADAAIQTGLLRHARNDGKAGNVGQHFKKRDKRTNGFFWRPEAFVNGQAGEADTLTRVRLYALLAGHFLEPST